MFRLLKIMFIVTNVLSYSPKLVLGHATNKLNETNISINYGNIQT